MLAPSSPSPSRYRQGQLETRQTAPVGVSRRGTVWWHAAGGAVLDAAARRPPPVAEDSLLGVRRSEGAVPRQWRENTHRHQRTPERSGATPAETMASLFAASPSGAVALSTRCPLPVSRDAGQASAGQSHVGRQPPAWAPRGVRPS